MTATYYTGKPCRNGHDSPRYIATGLCVECKRGKTKRHYDKHAEVRKVKSSAYYYENHERGKAVRQAYYQANREVGLIYRRDQWAKNRERYLAQKRERNATPEAKAAKAAKRKEQAHLYRGYEQKRRARLKGAIPKWYGELDDFAFEHAAELCDLRRKATGLAWEVDHMIPLLATRATGLHWHANIQVIPQRLNRQKNRRMILTQPREWIAHA